MVNLETRVNLLVSKGVKKEALIFASAHGFSKRCRVVFSESDLNDYEPGNLIGQVNSLAKEGFIRWEYERYNGNDSKNINYQIKDIALTVAGEKLLGSYSLFSKAKPILIGIITGLLTAYLAIKLDLVK